MKFKIIHKTEYQFTSPVFLEPHYIRLKPRQTHSNRVEYFNLDITPQPAGISLQRDEEGNLIHFCWFEGLTPVLSIISESIVNSPEYNPFDFLIYPASYFIIPFAYSEFQKHSLIADLTHEPISAPLNNYGNLIAKEVNFDTIKFVTLLTQHIHADFVVEFRETGSPHQPDEAFELKRGSCRDLAWMQINLLRSMGIASRFVSGYFYFPLEKEVGYELHAWLEVFIPGAGWIGFDPSHGIITGYTHIPIVSSFQFQQTLPVTGTIRGDGESDLLTSVNIEVIT